MSAVSSHPLYRSWINMKYRCQSSSSHAFHRYGGRGIAVCERWNNSFESFVSDMGPRPAGTSLDRINNNDDYRPGNCRWATDSEQSSNRRPSSEWVPRPINSCGKRERYRNHLTYMGVTKPIAVWAEEVGLPRKTIRNRIYVCGWSVEKALLAPLGKRGVRSAWSSPADQLNATNLEQ